MTERARHTVGRSGRTVAPGRQARRLAPVLAVLGLVAGVLALVTWQQQGDLRDLHGLSHATATVLGVDDHRRRADTLHVEFGTPDGAQRAGIPYGGRADEGDEVPVAYVAAAPSRVRTVDDWDPAYVMWTVYAAVLLAAALVVGGFGLVSRWRSSRWESDDAAGELPVEALGRRVVRGSFAVHALLGAGGLASAAGCVVGVVRTEDDQVGFSIGLAVSVVLTAAALGAVHWYGGRDGVWTTDAELVARRRGRVRSWPWGQVRELGLVVDQGVATVAAARVDDGPADGIDDDGWLTLARPLAGPLAAHTWAARFRRLADERGLPFTEGLTGADLADGAFATSVRPRRSSRATSVRSSSLRGR